MILTIECPDNFHFVNISFIDQDKSKAVTRSFTKIELMEMDQYIERDNFVGFPADKIDDTIDTVNNLCDSCTNAGCEFQSGIVRTECAFYTPPRIETDNCGNYVVAQQNG